MKHPYPTWLILLILGVFILPAAAQTQSEMNAEAQARLEKLDADLNRVYQAKLKEHASDPQYIAHLREAQRAWLKYVEFHLKTIFPLKKGEDPRLIYGSMYPQAYAAERSAMFERRIAELTAAPPY